MHQQLRHAIKILERSFNCCKGWFRAAPPTVSSTMASEAGSSPSSKRSVGAKKGARGHISSAVGHANTKVHPLDGQSDFASDDGQEDGLLLGLGGGRFDPLTALRMYSETDEKFTALHRAAWFGDRAVISEIIRAQSPESLKVMLAKDSQQRTPLIVAATQGHHDALSLLASHPDVMNAEPEILEEKNDENKTAFEILAAHTVQRAAVIEPEQEFREQQLWSLHKTIEVTRITHTLASTYFRFRHFWFFFIPAAFLTALVSVLSFVSSSETITNSSAGDILPLVVGALGSVSVFLQTISEQLQYRCSAPARICAFGALRA